MAFSMPPAKSMWLSLSIIMSKRPKRWFCAPPTVTAYFSKMRMLGVVLRVSSSVTFVSFTRSTYSCVVVAIPLMRCMKLSKVRSAVSMLRDEPCRVNAMSPLCTNVPSGSNSSMRMFSSTWRSTSRATSTPANTPSCLTSSFMSPIASAGMQESEEWSPLPISSRNVNVINSLTCSVIFIFSLLFQGW